MNDAPTVQPRVRSWLDQVIANKRVSHAYLFTGPRGAGKRALAEYFSQALLCCADSPPCGVCSQCRRVQSGNHPDVHWIEPDGASLKIDQIRSLQHVFDYQAQEMDRQIAIIDQAETLTVQAANSLLKFLEEPHPGTVAILLTSRRQQLLSTIISRCQEIPFSPPSVHQVVERLAKDHDRSLATLAATIIPDPLRAAELCQAEWFAELQSTVIQLMEDVRSSKEHALFAVDNWLAITTEKEHIQVGLDMGIIWWNDVLYTLLDLPEKRIFQWQADRLEKQARLLREEQVAGVLEILLQTKRYVQSNVNAQLALEQMVIELELCMTTGG